MADKDKRVLIVDDHPIFRLGLRRLIDSEPGLVVCGEASDAREGLALAEATNPDLVTVDLSLSGGSGIELIRDLRVRFPTLPVLVLSVHDETLFAERALRVGAAGYLNKESDVAVLIDGLNQALAGEQVFSERIQSALMADSRRSPGARRTGGMASLSDRELEVFELMGRGMSTKEIANALFISAKTVATHQTRLRDKLGARSLNELIKTAVGWVAGLEDAAPKQEG